MSVAAHKHWDPRLDIRVFRGFPEQIVPTIRERMVSFRLEDHWRLVDKANITLENNDGSLFDLESLALGVVFQISLGYNGAMMSPRIMQCRKVTGASRVGGVGAGSGPRTAAGGLVTLELQSQIWNLNMVRAVTSLDRNAPRRVTGYQNMTIPNIVRAIGRRYGYDGPSLIVEDREQEETLPTYTIPTFMSDAEWIADQAKLRGWTFTIDDEGLHFHSPDRGASTLETLRWFYGDPDVISWETTGDLNVPQVVRVLGVETQKEASFGRAAATTPKENNPEGKTSETGFTKTGVIIAKQRRRLRTNSPETLVPSPSAKQREATIRRISKAMNRWKVKMKLVGNPKVRARRKIQLGNFGPVIDGMWTVTKAVHTYAADGVYFTEIEAKRRDISPGVPLVLFGRAAVPHGKPTGIAIALSPRDRQRQLRIAAERAAQEQST